MSPTVALQPVSAKITASEKKAFVSACDELGTTPSNAIRMFIKAFNEYGGFPFDTSHPYRLSKEAQESYDQAMADIASGAAKRYKDVASLREDLGL